MQRSNIFAHRNHDQKSTSKIKKGALKENTITIPRLEFTSVDPIKKHQDAHKLSATQTLSKNVDRRLLDNTAVHRFLKARLREEDLRKLEKVMSLAGKEQKLVQLMNECTDAGKCRELKGLIQHLHREQAQLIQEKVTVDLQIVIPSASTKSSPAIDQYFFELYHLITTEDETMIPRAVKSSQQRLAEMNHEMVKRLRERNAVLAQIFSQFQSIAANSSLSFKDSIKSIKQRLAEGEKAQQKNSDFLRELIKAEQVNMNLVKDYRKLEQEFQYLVQEKLKVENQLDRFQTEMQCRRISEEAIKQKRLLQIKQLASQVAKLRMSCQSIKQTIGISFVAQMQCINSSVLDSEKQKCILKQTIAKWSQKYAQIKVVEQKGSQKWDYIKQVESEVNERILSTEKSLFLSLMSLEERIATLQNVSCLFLKQKKMAVIQQSPNLPEANWCLCPTVDITVMPGITYLCQADTQTVSPILACQWSSSITIEPQLTLLDIASKVFNQAYTWTPQPITMADTFSQTKSQMEFTSSVYAFQIQAIKKQSQDQEANLQPDQLQRREISLILCSNVFELIVKDTLTELEGCEPEQREQYREDRSWRADSLNISALLEEESCISQEVVFLKRQLEDCREQLARLKSQNCQEEDIFKFVL